MRALRFWCVAVLGIFGVQAVLAQTAWPTYMAELEPGLSESAEAAALPADVVITAPAAGLPAHRARWSGIWHGWACHARLCDVKLAIERVSDAGATVVYAGAMADRPIFIERAEAQFADDELVLVIRTGARLVLRMRSSGDVEMSLWKSGPQLTATGVLTQTPISYSRSIERVPTPWVENGHPQTLEMVAYRPSGPGPFPTLIFNHGSTGNGDRPDWFVRTWTAPEVAGYFTSKGWQVLLPQRRGRGKSDGLYDEGFKEDRSGYACQASLSLAGLERAMSDLDAVMAHVKTRQDVDQRRLLIGGVSRGGILSAAYAGTRPHAFLGVLNFVGGWVGDRCWQADDINGGSFKRAAAFAGPMLWLYGDNDRFYSLRHSRKNFEAFKSAGGQGTLVEFDPGSGQSGHGIHLRPALWRPVVDDYLQRLSR